jgi:hypothetical protein
MRTTLSILLPAVLLAGAASPAFAGGSKGSIGVGAEATLGSIALGPGFDIGLGGISANYDMGEFHVGGFLGFADGGDEDDTLVSIGGRFYYHIHSTAMADFGTGGTAGMAFIGDGDPDSENPQLMLIEPGLQIRAFIASNVALSFSAGLSIGLMDADGFVLTGQETGAAGFHYYFF